MPKKVKRSKYSTYRWNPSLGSTGRYIDENGRMVPSRDVVRQTERVIKGVRQEMRGLSLDLAKGDISLQRWYNGMRERIKLIHGLHAAIAKGGWANMTQGDWGRVGALTKKEYQYLANFALELKTGKQKLDGSFLYRSEMYAMASRRTASEVARHEAKKKHTEEKRVLGVADHCTTRGGKVGCLELAGRGWQPITSMPQIGDTPCRIHCHCHYIYR